MKKAINIIIVIAVIAGLVALAAFKLSNNKKEVEAKVYHPNIDTKAVVQVDTIKTAAFAEATPFLGSFVPSREVTIASETSGKVITVGIKEGSHVQTGTLIAKLDDGVLQAQLHSAKANLDNATSTLKRYEQAAAGVTQLQMDNAKTQILTTQAQIEQLNKQINQYTIKAPFSGVITTRNFDLGAVISPGAALATLIDINNLKLEVNVPEKFITAFKTGMPMMVKTDVYPNINFKGTVDFIASKADASHNYTVKILVGNGDKNTLKSGMYGSVTLEKNSTKPSISIQRAALVGTAIKPQVYVVENGIAQLRDIVTGESNANNIQVIAGLNNNELVVIGGLVNLTNGTKVSIK